MTLEGLALSRSDLDRAAERRADPDLIPSLLADERTLAVPVVGGRAPVLDRPEKGPELALLAPPSARTALGGDPAPEVYFLGVDAEGRGYLTLSWPEGGAEPPLPADVAWLGLREAGLTLDDRDAGILTTSVALGAWHHNHPRCSRCGTPTEVSQAGWVRSCPQCGAEHYPRTDPAVIMAVVGPDDRILLGHQATWPEGRYSTLAGFVEPGESLEAAVRREVHEESGIVVGEVSYRGSQPWPFPSSLMLGFVARAESDAVQVDGVEISHARWWTREELTADVAAGTLLVPPGVSIARRLIEEWYGGPIEGATEAWR